MKHSSRASLLLTRATVASFLIILSGLELASSITSHLPHRHHIQSFGPNVYHRYYLAPSFLNSKGISMGGPAEPTEVATQFAMSALETDASQFILKNSYVSEHTGVTHVYFRQVVNGLEVINGDMNVNVDRDGRVISFGDGFYKGKEHTLKANERVIENIKALKKSNVIEDRLSNIWDSIQERFSGWSDNFRQIAFGFPSNHRRSRNPLSRRFRAVQPSQYTFANSHLPIITPLDALRSLFIHIQLPPPSPELVITSKSTQTLNTPQLHYTLHNVPFALSPVPVHKSYIQLDSGELQLVWTLAIEMSDNWFHAHVNAHTGEIQYLVDWVADATYNVFPLGYNDPSDGPRVRVTDPHDEVASPLGWHVQGDVKGQEKSRNYTTTVGNNVYAHENTKGGWNWESNYRPDGGVGLVFDFPLDWKKTEPKQYMDAAVVNLFYWNNIIHDLYYRYGFTEAAGNFQEDNSDRGGLGGDAVVANAQDGSGYNNANFATPPDGQRGKMRMYIWDVTTPMRDGDLESGIIVHEYSHGLSTRLTGGPANSGCLGWGEAGGLGEGWGDFFSTILRMKETNTRKDDFDMGAWVNGGDGIRKYKYSTNLKTNPETYAIMNKPGYWGVHAKGAVWAVMLYEVYWNLVDKHGFTTLWFPPTTSANDTLHHITSHGNTLALQVVIDGMKLQPCRPDFINARDAILQAEELLTGGENVCEIWKGFAKRGLGVDARLEGDSPWGGSQRKESFTVPVECR